MPVGLLLPGLPELKKVVVVPYVSSAGQDAAVSSLENGFVHFIATCKSLFYDAWHNTLHFHVTSACNRYYFI